jgi:hypothetical protein
MFNFAPHKEKFFDLFKESAYKTLLPGPKRLKKCWSVISRASQGDRALRHYHGRGDCRGWVAYR